MKLAPGYIRMVGSITLERFEGHGGLEKSLKMVFGSKCTSDWMGMCKMQSQH